MQQSPIESAIRSVLARGDGSAPWTLLGRLVEGGQRIRPRLVVAVSGALGAEAGPSLHADAAAMELVHLSTLIHDDIIDGGQARRGVPTLSAAHGPEIALLVGNVVKDHALALASPGARAVLNQASLDVNLGQLRETMARGSSLRFDQLFEIQLYKTARAFRHCARLAGLHAPRPPGDGPELALELAALAFQAVDDWLDLAPARAHTQKDGSRDEANLVPCFVQASGVRVEGVHEPAVLEAVRAVASLGWGHPLASLGPAAARVEVLRLVRALASRAQSHASGSGTEHLVEQLFRQVAARADAVALP